MRIDPNHKPEHIHRADGTTACGIAVIGRKQAQEHYSYLRSRYWTRFPYRPTEVTRADGSGGYVDAMIDVAMIAFGLNEQEAAERVAEDLQDHVAYLG